MFVIDPSVFIGARLFPDMLPLVRQVYITTDTAKGCAARLAGVEPPKFDDVEVTFEDGVLTITGKRSTSETAKDATYLRRERRTTSVFRQVGLPAEVRADDITASFENGVLRITVPRAQKAQPKRIPVTVTGTAEKTEQIVEHAPVATA